MTDYGLPGHRDSDGNRKETDYTFEWDDDEVTIRLLPPTLSEIDQLENLPEDVEPERLRDSIDDILVKPELDEEPTMPEMMCYMVGIKRYAYSGGTDLAQDARDELEERGDDPGN